MVSKLRFFLFFILIFPVRSFAFDDLQEYWNIDLLYSYSRIERSSLFQTENFQSRQGVMLQLEYEDQISLFSRWYVGGDLSANFYEAAASVSFSPRALFPAQVYAGLGFQMGDLKAWEIFFGAGPSTEIFILSSGSNNYNMETGYSLRVHGGFSWRFLSITGSSSQLLVRYSYPVTPVNQNGVSLSFRGILDGSIRLRGRYDSLLSLLAGVRFEDYSFADESVTFFSTRVYAGVGFHFN
ncbi:MAG: hypothetical protein KDD33_11445 [Bdellovibrionales bacterium]|nr:hypothetical protein [Bdellovibrionales bacterium]